MYRIDEAEVQAVRKVLLSKRLFRYQGDGPGECDLFEQEFSKYLGVKHSILVSSGTNALVAALKSLDLGEGDEVIVPAYTFVATAAAVKMIGARPVIADIDEHLGLCAESVEKKITPKTKAIIPVHMDGLAADLENLLSLAKEKNLLVIEDVAQALGGSYQDRHLGSWGDAGAFSLNENKHISCGEGGIVVTSDDEVYQKQFLMQDLASRYNPVKMKQFKFPSEFLGSSMRVSEIQGALMRVQLTRLEPTLSELRVRKSILKEILLSLPEVKVIESACAGGDCGSSLHLSFSDPLQTLEAFKGLGQAGIKAYPPSLRPAHVAWKWLKDIDPDHDRAAKSDLAASVQRLSCVLKYDVDPEMSPEATKEFGTRMRNRLKEVLHGCS